MYSLSQTANTYSVGNMPEHNGITTFKPLSVCWLCVCAYVSAVRQHRATTKVFTVR